MKYRYLLPNTFYAAEPRGTNDEARAKEFFAQDDDCQLFDSDTGKFWDGVQWNDVQNLQAQGEF